MYARGEALVRRCAAGIAGSTTSRGQAAATSACRATSWPPASPTSRSSGSSRCCCWSHRSSGCSSRATPCCRSSSSTRSARPSPVTLGEQLVHEVTSAVGSAGVTGLIGLVGFLYAGLRTVDKLRIGMELIWKGRGREVRHPARQPAGPPRAGRPRRDRGGQPGPHRRGHAGDVAGDELLGPRDEPRLRRPDLGRSGSPSPSPSTSSSSCGCCGSCPRSRTRCAGCCPGRCSARPASRCSSCSAATT